MSRPKFHKLYFPGLISLVFLPLMCIYYLIDNGAFHRYRVMDVSWENKESLHDCSKYENKKIDVEAFLKYKKLSLTGNVNHDASDIKKVSTLIRQLENNSDTLNGIKVSLGNHANYADLVEVLDICYRNESKNITGMPYDNQIFIWFIKSVKQTSLPDLDKGGYNEMKNFQILGDDTTLTKFQRFLTTISKYLVPFWPCALIFILMLYFTFSKKIRYLDLKFFGSINH